jgi:hypothetical protein
MDEEPVVERAPEFHGWRIRSKDQLPGTGMIVTDHWLHSYGFGRPTKFNIQRIIGATIAAASGHATERIPDLGQIAKKWGDPFSEKGAAPDIQFGEGLRGH